MEDRGKIRSFFLDSLGGVRKRHGNNNTQFSLLHKFSKLRLCIDNVLTSTIWDEMHFISIGKTDLNPV